jgi:hypothetical protein
MNYELARQLKDAGFPAKTCVFCNEMGDGRVSDATWHKPTLTELIEGSGDKLDILERTRGGFRQIGSWVARTLKLGPLAGAFYGDTPEEAVARLWLALRGKDGAAVQQVCMLAGCKGPAGHAPHPRELFKYDDFEEFTKGG